MRGFFVAKRSEPRDKAAPPCEHYVAGILLDGGLLSVAPISKSKREGKKA
jgi:hypothetical protein